jgi:hypothetical protein
VVKEEIELTTVKEPVKTFTGVPRPIKAPVLAPPVEQPAPERERELVPLKRKEGNQ